MEYTDGKKNMKDKIEEILRDFDSKNNVMVATEIMGLRQAIDEIATLCGEQRADAVNGFVESIGDNPVGNNLIKRWLGDRAEEYLKEQNI